MRWWRRFLLGPRREIRRELVPHFLEQWQGEQKTLPVGRVENDPSAVISSIPRTFTLQSNESRKSRDTISPFRAHSESSVMFSVSYNIRWHQSCQISSKWRVLADEIDTYTHSFLWWIYVKTHRQCNLVYSSYISKQRPLFLQSFP